MSTLEKIRAEIADEKIDIDLDIGQEIHYNRAIDDVLAIIDKYAEQEPKTGRWMTKKEAIKELQESHDMMRSYNIDESESRLMTALNMAIKALEQEPCDDVVSRQYIKQKLQEHYDFFVGAYGGYQNMSQNDKARVDEITNCIAEVVNAPSVRPQEPIQEQWQELKETILEMRDNDGTGTQQEVCKFLVNYMEVLEKQMQETKTGHWIVDGSGDCYLDTVRCHCSECGKKKKFPADYDHIKQELSISYKHHEFIDNFCPNCGAKMVEPQESEESE